MIGLFKDDGTRLALTYNGLTHNDPSDDPDDTFAIDSVSTIVPVDGPNEARPADDGAEVYTIRKQMIILRIDGTIRATSLAALYDKKRQLAAAWDPAKAAHEDSTNETGVLPLDFSVPTADTATWATGLVPSRYYARARQTPVPVDSLLTGFACFFSLDVMVPDPRRYHQTEQSQSGAATVDQIGDYRTLPTLTITMAGAGSATYAVTNDPDLAGIASSTLTLDLSGCVNTDVVVVDMASKTITKNGTEDPTIYVSGDYFALEPGDNAISYANTTNATSVLTWRHAWTV